MRFLFSQIFFNAAAVLALVVFPVIPGFCECAEALPIEPGCCQDGMSDEAPQPLCPDTLHLCFLNAPDVDVRVDRVSVDSLDGDIFSEHASPLFATARLFAYREAPKVKPYFPPVEFESNTTRLIAAPTRGPPRNTY